MIYLHPNHLLFPILACPLMQSLMFTSRDTADYYNQTLNHYQNWWKLNQNLAVHYGIWDENTSNFQDALINTNKVVMEMVNISDGESILDAGCGVGGSVFYIAKHKKVKVWGITLSEKQHAYAVRKCSELGFDDVVNFKIEDYSQTSFSNNSFDVIWAIESITSANNKEQFAKEAFRLLKPGGRLIIADYFRTKSEQEDPKELLEKWRKLWTMAPFLTLAKYKTIFQNSGFSISKELDVTKQITPTAKRMYWSYLIGGPLAVAYNIFNNPRKYARSHYKSGLYQYKALKKELWNYTILLFEKD